VARLKSCPDTKQNGDIAKRNLRFWFSEGTNLGLS
jgi:hypothetical protein